MTQVFRYFLYLFPALMLFAALLPLYFKLKWQEEKRAAIAVKALCTLVPIVFCLNGCLVNSYIGFWWLLSGLVFCLIGDVAIERNLFAGMGAFAVAHGLFIRTFLMMAAPTWMFVPVFVFLLAAAAIGFRHKFGTMGKLRIPFIAYAAVIFSMLSLALTLPFVTGTAVMAVGATLFAGSDMVLAHWLLREGGATRRGDVLCLVLYYAALYLFALAVWL